MKLCLSPPVVFLLIVPGGVYFVDLFVICVFLCYTVISVSFSLVVTC